MTKKDYDRVRQAQHFNLRAARRNANEARPICAACQTHHAATDTTLCTQCISTMNAADRQAASRHGIRVDMYGAGILSDAPTFKSINKELDADLYESII